MKSLISNVFAVVSCITCIGTVGCDASKSAEADLNFYGADNQSATMSFSTVVEFAPERKVRNAAEFVSGTERKQAERIVQRQIDHTFGVFSEHPEFVRNPGIIQTRGKLEIQSGMCQET